MSEVKKFQTETKRLLDLMINSIYTNQEIFLRELISNASDAIDKYHYLSLTDKELEKRNDYEIHLEKDKEARTLSISDNGIGMTYDELNENLGTIAKSGTQAFLKKMEEVEKKKEKIDTIGQFGVGFYSAFMVSKKVVVETKSPYSEKGYRFTSDGRESYEVEEIDKTASGTTITLYLKENEDEQKYDEYLDQYTLRRLVKKYSDYIRYPITMYVQKKEPKLDDEGKPIENEFDEVTELETLNSMVPIWKKNKKDVTDKQINDFFMQKFYEFEEPMFHLMFNIEGNINYSTLLFIPKQPPYDLHSMNYERGLQLYAKGVFVMDKCKDLIPQYLRFIKGIVDSNDLSLNISREMLQHNRILQLMAKNIEKKILSKLENLMKSDFDQYLEFFKSYGIELKYGIYENYGARKDDLQDLLIYHSTTTDKMISFKEYVENLKEDQKDIYYVSAKSKEEVESMPQMDIVKKRGYNVLILMDDIDEFVIKILGKYQDHEFKSINQTSIDDLLDEEEKEKLDEINEKNKDLLSHIKEALKDDVKDVIISKRLTDSPVCLVAGDGLSFEMEKVLSKMPNNQNEQVKAERILEINPNHELFSALEKVYKDDPKEINDYATLLYDQALLMEGFKIDDPVKFSNLMCKLLIKSTK